MSDFKPYRLGAVVLKRGKLVSRGFNTVKTHRKLIEEHGYYGPSHAESVALMRANNEGDTLLVVRIKRNGDLSCSRPCGNCMAMARKSGIRTIYFSNWQGEIEAINV